MCLALAHAYACKCLCCASVCVLCLYKEHVASCVFTLENIGESKGLEEKGRPVNRKSHDGDGE